MPDQTQNQSTYQSPFPQREMPRPSGERDLNPATGSKRPTVMPFLRLLGVLAITSILAFTAFFLSGFLSGLSANITTQNGVTYFDPLITVAYLAVFYCLTFLYSFTTKQRLYYFFLAITLSYTINFVEGSTLLLVLFPTLRFLKLIEKQS